MAITSSGSFVATNNKIAGTSFSFTTTGQINSGSLGVLLLAADNLGAAQNSTQFSAVTDNVISYNFLQGTGFDSTAKTIISQSDGKILVGGDFSSYNQSEAPFIVRLNSDGSIDSTFQSRLDGSINSGVCKLAIQTGVTGSYFSGTGIWSAGGTMITTRAGLQGSGTQNSAFVAGGNNGGPTFIVNTCTEEYDGSTWSNGGALITARNVGSAVGVQNVGLAIGGLLAPPTSTRVSCTEEYNGSTWSAGGALITARNFGGRAGSQNSGLVFGGDTGIGVIVGCTEEYNGTSWSTGGSLINTRNCLQGTGFQNSAIGVGGLTPTTVGCTEEYNGTSWSSSVSLITARWCPGASGVQNSTLVIGGSVGPLSVSCTETFNGISWTTGGNLICARNSNSGAGLQNTGLAMGGVATAATNVTEEYNVPTITCTSDKIVAVGQFGTVRLNNDGSTDPSLNVGTGFNNTVCTVIIEDGLSYSSAGVWSVGGTLITSRIYLGGAGLQNETLAFGGLITPAAVSCTEEYNGTSWSVGGVLITGRYSLAGAGTQNIGLAFGGITNTQVSCTEEYNGTSWSAGGAQINSLSSLGGAGTQNAGLSFGGFTSGAVTVSCTEEYNGTSWSVGGSLINTLRCLAGAGTQNSGLAFGGITNVIVGCTEEYNGTSWSAGIALITSRFSLGGAGTQNAGLSFAGQNTPGINTTCTEEYDGTLWTVGGSLITSRSALAGAGAQDQAVSFGGSGGGTCTEEYNKTLYDSKIITGGLFTSYCGSVYSGSVKLKGDGSIDTTFSASTGFSGTTDVRDLKIYPNLAVWSTGGSMITARFFLAGTGTQNEGLVFGGQSPTTVGCTEEYNGTTWSVGGALITTRTQMAGAGTQNLGLTIGGSVSGINCTCTEEYNGTSWSAGGALITARSLLAAAGTQNLGLAFGGSTPSTVGCTEEYNGTSWSAGGALIVSRDRLAGAGTQNSGLAFGGLAAPIIYNCTEEYDGATWSSANNMINSRYASGGAGTQNLGLAFGGFSTPTDLSCTEEFNGTSWFAGGALITCRDALAGGGTQTAAFAAGGILSPATIYSCTEEYTTGNYVVASGNFVSYSGTSRNRIALINLNDGTLVTGSFNIGTGFSSTVNSVNVDNNNQLFAVGNFTGYNSTSATRIVKINKDGTTDTSFSQGTGFNAEACVVCNYICNNGTWSTTTALITSRSVLAGAGTGNQVSAFGGISSPVTYSCTEEYDGATWAAGGTLITARSYIGGAGTQNASLAFGGITTSPTCVTCTEEYNGNTWASGGNMIVARVSVKGLGSQNAALATGGVVSPNACSCTEEYDGTTWISGGSLITPRWIIGPAGTQNLALAFGGNGPGILTCTEEYNGVSWSSGGSLINARGGLGGSGIQNNAISFAGTGSGSSASDSTEHYDGTTWSSLSPLITGQLNGFGFGGSETTAILFQNTNAQQYESSADVYVVGGTFNTYNGQTYSGITFLKDNGNIYAGFNDGNGFSATTDVKNFLVYSEGSLITIGNFTYYSSSYTPNPNRIVKTTSGGTVDASSTTGSTWVKLQEYSDGSAAGAGATVAMYYVTPSTVIASGTTITVTFSGGSVTAKAASGWAYDGTNITGYTGTTTATQLQPGSLTVTGSTSSSSGEHLYVRGTAFENTTLTFTPTTNFSAFTQSATSGGSAITNIGIVGEFRIVTATSATSNPTLSTSTSNASVMYSFYEVTTATGRTYFIVIN